MTEPRPRQRTGLTRTTRVRAAFGLPIEPSAGRQRARTVRRRAIDDAKRLRAELETCTAALVTGPSGAGKSLLIDALARSHPRCVRVEPVPRRIRKAPVDLIDRPLDEALTLLSRLGLADARRLVTPAGRLSEGERARLAIALAFDNARSIRDASGRAALVLADEFASTLDSPTASALAVAARRTLPADTGLVAATARDELAAELRPDLLVFVPFEAPAEIHRLDPGRRGLCEHRRS
ncbi:MAG: hypothetical protein AAGH71_01910 [Planctomycetota bacterium]